MLSFLWFSGSKDDRLMRTSVCVVSQVFCPAFTASACEVTQQRSVVPVSSPPAIVRSTSTSAFIPPLKITTLPLAEKTAVVESHGAN